MFVFAGSYDVIPENYKKDIQNKIRGFYSHNPMVQAVGTTVDEVYATAKVIGEKLNLSTKHTAVCIPMRGFGAYDSAMGLPQSGWTEEKDSPNWIP
ncbi:MAG TPA: hypothetical protein DCS12_04245, partial [Clostridiales bacterium]|nr:hypothetical protein [Clostridiales bacterium]